jgi:hypothetical protein
MRAYAVLSRSLINLSSEDFIPAAIFIPLVLRFIKSKFGALSRGVIFISISRNFVD